VVLDSKGVRVAIVAVDLIGYFKNEVDTARALVSPASDVDFAVVASTHQHEGPDTLGIWGPDAFTTSIDFGYHSASGPAAPGSLDSSLRWRRRFGSRRTARNDAAAVTYRNR
jgi:hypothetical protein